MSFGLVFVFVLSGKSFIPTPDVMLSHANDPLLLTMTANTINVCSQLGKASPRQILRTIQKNKSPQPCLRGMLAGRSIKR